MSDIFLLTVETITFECKIFSKFHEEGGHNGRKSLILAPQEIPDISGYQWGFGRRFVKAYNTENPVTSQKIL